MLTTLLALIYLSTIYIKNEKVKDVNLISKTENKGLINNNPMELSNLFSLNEKIRNSLIEISNADDTFSTILISIHFDQQKIVSFIKKYQNFFKENKFYIYETEIGDKSGFCITYGKFEDLTSAKEAISKLPRQILDNKPYIRILRNKKKLRKIIVQKFFKNN